MAGRFFRGSVGLALAVVALITIGCGGGGASLVDDVGRNVRNAVRAGAKLPEERIELTAIGRVVPENQLPEISAQADDVGEQLARSAERRAATYDEAKELLDTACYAKDFSEGHVFPQPLSQEVRQLAAELREAEDYGDVGEKLAVFAACNS
jgi:hypothetical protein